MKIVLLLIILSSFNCKPHSTQMTLQEQASSLEEFYKLVITNKNNVQEREHYEGKFFNLFPDTFGRFDSLYGYHPEDKKLGILLNESDNHINLFYDAGSISEELRMRKIVNISINGTWDADAIGFFQHKLQEKIQNETKLAIRILEAHSVNEIKKFWQFYFDGPHPGNYQRDYEELYIKIINVDKSVAKLLKEAYEDLISNQHAH